MDQTPQYKFASIYESEADALFRYCLVRTSDREVSLDLTQDIFLRLWKALNAGKVIEYERAFLFTVARHLVIDWYRKKKSFSLDKMMEEHESDMLVLADSKHDALMDAEARELVDKIDKLEPMYQQVLYLRFVEDLRPKEIAAVLEKPVNVVSVRITRGVAKLRKLYE